MVEGPHTVDELIAHPDYRRLLDAGPRSGGPTRTRRFHPLLLFAALVILVGTLLQREGALQGLPLYAMLVFLALLFAGMLVRRGGGRDLAGLAARVESLGGSSGEPGSTRRVRLDTGQPPPLDLEVREELAVQLTVGDVGVAFHDGRRLHDLRRPGDPDLLL